MSFDHSNYGLFNDFPEPVFVIDREGTILFANKAFASRFFVMTDENQGRNVYEMFTSVDLAPDIAADRKAKIEEALHTGRHSFFEDEQDGRHWRHLIHPERSSEGTIDHLLIIAHDITIAKQTEHQSRKDNLFFKTLLGAVPGSVVIIDASGRISGFNHYAMRVFGKCEQELCGIDPFEIIHPEDRSVIREKFRAILERDVEEAAEAKVCMGGDPQHSRWFSLHARKTVIDGQPFVVTVSIDIDERKKAEHTLLESRRWLKLALEAAETGIWDRNVRTGENTWSDELWSLSGLENGSEPCSFDLWTSLIHPDDRERVLRNSNIVDVERAQTTSLEYRICRPDGSIRWILSRGKAVRDNMGAVERVVGTIMDITDRKLMEEKLKRSHNRLDFMLEKCHLGWWEFDPVSNTTLRTLEHDRIFGYDTLRPEWHFEMFLDHVIAEDRSTVRRLCHKAQETLDDFSFECRIRRNDGRICWIWVAGGFQLDMLKNHSVMSGLVQDISDRKLQEEKQVQLQTELQQSQKMEAIGQLAGGIAHDFNNALTAILGNADLLTRKVSPSFPFLENIDDIRKSALRSASMTRQLLAFARKQMITPEVCRIDEEIDTLHPMIGSLLGSHLRFQWRPGSDRACVLIDPSQIDQIVINLCINARDAITDHGTITIETSTVTIGAGECATGHPCQTPGDYVRVAVCDTGCGIDARTLPHIFEPFFTTKEIGKGTGLGLSTVYGILKQNKGFIDCLTESGQGTTFVVYLPRYHESAENRPDEPDDLSVRFSHATILLVEDAPDILAILKGLLEEQGFRILEAGNAETALNLARQYPPGSIDLLVTDIMLPDINGIRLSEELQGIQPGLKTLYMSGYAQETINRQKNLDKEANFIQKPFSINTFLGTVSKMLVPSGM